MQLLGMAGAYLVGACDGVLYHSVVENAGTQRCGLVKSEREAACSTWT